jgi:hypothetical protein
VKDVLGGLKEICPCREVDVGGGITAGIVTVTLGDASDCVCLCKYPASCNLLNALDQWSESVLVIEAAGNQYDPDDNRLFWDPTTTDTGVDEDMCGGNEIPASLILAHEMIHAHHDQLGKSLDDLWLEEYATVRGENQIRLEQCRPPRLTYGGQKVPQLTQPDIDASDPGTCACGGGSSGFSIMRYLRCFADFSGQCENRAVGLRNLFQIALLGDRPTPEGRHMRERSEFEAYFRGADASIVERVRLADSLRRRSPLWERVERLKQRTWASGGGFVLEGVDATGRYRVIAIWTEPPGSSGREPNRLLLATNLSIREGWSPDQQDTPFVGRVGDLLEYRIPLEPGRGPAPFDPVLPPFVPGIGGKSSVADGTVQFVTAQDRDSARSMALFGYTHPGFHGVWKEPDDPVDLERWRAVNLAYRTWRDILLSGPPPGTPLR